MRALEPPRWPGGGGGHLALGPSKLFLYFGLFSRPRSTFTGRPTPWRARQHGMPMQASCDSSLPPSLSPHSPPLPSSRPHSLYFSPLYLAFSLGLAAMGAPGARRCLNGYASDGDVAGFQGQRSSAAARPVFWSPHRGHGHRATDVTHVSRALGLPGRVLLWIYPA